MCTAVTYQTNHFYFGRTLDYESSYGEEIVILPRKFPLPFLHMGTVTQHYAIMGIAHVANQYSLFYDAINEKGLCMAGLNFVGNAHYAKNTTGENEVAQYEFIPWILSTCATTAEAKERISSIRITDTPFCEQMPVGQLHWMIADKDDAIVVECVEDGLHVYDNPVGVLTNNPPFPVQMFMLNNYMHVSPSQPENHFAKELPLATYSRGMGGLGLPGDLSSASRFAKVAFTKLHAISGESEAESVSQFFHILGSVEQQRGCCEVEPGKYEITIYTSCVNADKGIYYYTTYENHQIQAVDMHREDLDGDTLRRYPLINEEQIRVVN